MDEQNKRRKSFKDKDGKTRWENENAIRDEIEIRWEMEMRLSFKRSHLKKRASDNEERTF